MPRSSPDRYRMTRVSAPAEASVAVRGVRWSRRGIRPLPGGVGFACCLIALELSHLIDEFPPFASHSKGPLDRGRARLRRVRRSCHPRRVPPTRQRRVYQAYGRPLTKQQARPTNKGVHRAMRIMLRRHRVPTSLFVRCLRMTLSAIVQVVLEGRLASEARAPWMQMRRAPEQRDREC